MKTGFYGFLSIQYLHTHGFSSISNKNGVYMVCIPQVFSKKILGSTTAIEAYKEQSLLYTVEELERKWVEESDILYIGKAGSKSNHLQQRIRQFVRYAYSEGNNHRGGRALWQLENCHSLLIGYKEVLDAREAERSLICEFQTKFGKRPFANFRT